MLPIAVFAVAAGTFVLPARAADDADIDEQLSGGGGGGDGGAGGCASDVDCQLNGVCEANRCKCDPAWSAAADCSALSLAPVESVTPAYPPPALFNTTTSWGGSVLRDPADGR